MKAQTQYTDLTGTVAADISDFTTRSNQLNEVANHFNLDQKRFKVVGINIYGIENFSVSFICVDRQRSTDDKELICTIRIETNEKEVLSLLFKRLNIVLYEKFDEKYRNLEIDDELFMSEIE